ncbi:hypothetical protein ACIPIN_13980 [Pseudomonas sp. NPDC087697]|uniref:hypothetical protein n=1 Tax=Pseudomonas sp. NPDC087697 TaxID=3364447 RepID=UPI0037FCC87E
MSNVKRIRRELLVSVEIVHVLATLDQSLVTVINDARQAGLPQGFIVALLHGQVSALRVAQAAEYSRYSLSRASWYLSPVKDFFRTATASSAEAAANASFSPRYAARILAAAIIDSSVVPMVLPSKD